MLALPSARAIALGKDESVEWVTWTPALLSVTAIALDKTHTFVECRTQALGKDFVTVTYVVTVSFLCRVWIQHSTKSPMSKIRELHVECSTRQSVCRMQTVLGKEHVSSSIFFYYTNYKKPWSLKYENCISLNK